MTRPSRAELARTALASARVGALTTYPRHGAPRPTQVSVRDDHGSVVLGMSVRSWAAADLASRPLATLRIHPAECRPVTTHGAVRVLPRRPDGLALFRLQVAAVRIGSRSEPVDITDYRRAEPDPLRAEVPDMLRHLRHGHGIELAACLRAHGHTGARWAEPRSVDRYGLELTVLDDQGVSTARLDFARPVSCTDDLPASLSVIMRGTNCCGC